LTGQAPGSERVLADLADDRVRERAGVHRVRALFRDQPARLRVLGVHEPETGRMRLPVPIVVMRAERVARLEALELVEQEVEARRDLEALLRERDRGLEKLRPRQTSVLPVRELEHPEHAGDTDREPPERAFSERHRVAVLVEE